MVVAETKAQTHIDHHRPFVNTIVTETVALLTTAWVVVMGGFFFLQVGGARMSTQGAKASPLSCFAFPKVIISATFIAMISDVNAE